jgi:outer membrane immunogenic protein
MRNLAWWLPASISALLVSPAAWAADLADDPVAARGFVEAGDWDGFFVGALVGYGPGTLATEGEDDEFIPDPTGWLAGLNAGVNFTLTDGMVAGLVGDIAWANMSDTIVTGGASFDADIDWAGSVRGRVGIDGGSFLPYLTAGLAVAHNSIVWSGGLYNGEDDATHIGWTAGAGVELALNESLSVDLLYRYSDYGDAGYTMPGPGDFDMSLTAHQVSVGVNLGF